MVKPKGIRKAAMSSKRPSYGYSGVAIDIVSMITTAQTSISESVEVNNPTAHNTQTITLGVGVVVT